MKALIASDLHLMCLLAKLHLKICKERAILALSGLLNVVKTKCPDYLIIAGDMLNKSSQGLEVQEFLNEILQAFLIEASKIAKVLILAGNHDKSGDFSGLSRYDFLQKLIDVRFFNYTHEVVSTPFDYDILMIPYGVGIHKVVKDKQNKKPKIGFGHFMVNGCVYDNLMEVQKAINPKSLYKIAKILNVKEFFIGDNHKRQVIYDKGEFKAVHIGSMMQTKINESQKSHVILWDSDNDSKLIAIPNLYMTKVFDKKDAIKVREDDFAIGLTSDVDLCISENIILDPTVSKTKIAKKDMDEFDYSLNISVESLLKKYIAKSAGREGVQLLQKAKGLKLADRA